MFKAHSLTFMLLNSILFCLEIVAEVEGIRWRAWGGGHEIVGLRRRSWDGWHEGEDMKWRAWEEAIGGSHEGEGMRGRRAFIIFVPANLKNYEPNPGPSISQCFCSLLYLLCLRTSFLCLSHWLRSSFLSFFSTDSSNEGSFLSIPASFDEQNCS